MHVYLRIDVQNSVPALICEFWHNSSTNLPIEEYVFELDKLL